MGAQQSRPSSSTAKKGASAVAISHSWSRIVKGTVRHKHVFHIDEMLNALRSATEVSSSEFNVADGIRMKLALVKKDKNKKDKNKKDKNNNKETPIARYKGKPGFLCARNIFSTSTSKQEIGRIPKNLCFKVYCLDANNDIFNIKISLLKEGSDKKYYTYKVKKTLSAGDSFEVSKSLSTGKLRNRIWGDKDHFLVKENTFTIVCEVGVNRMGILTVGNSKTNIEEVSFDKSLAADLLSLREKPDTCDVALLSASGKRFPVHSFILKARSRELAKRLDSAAEQRTEIALHPKLRDDVIDIIIEFMYTDGIPNGLDVPLAIRLLLAAQLYGLDGLKDTAEDFLVSKLDPNAAVDFLRIGHKASATLLIRKAAEIIEAKFEEFRGRDKWIQLVKEIPAVANYVVEVVADKRLGAAAL